MSVSVRRLGPGDEAILALLAREDADFDLADRSESQEPLARDAAQAYLADRNVLHWIAEEQSAVVGFVNCNLLRKRSGDGAELLLYEIGVRSGHRRRGVGRALVAAMRAWMDESGIRVAWVLADNAGAVDFYRACGFRIEEDVPVYMTLGET